MIYEIQWMNEILLHKNISLILFSEGAQSLLLVLEINGKKYTLRGDFFLFHIFLRESVGANACTSLQAGSSETT